MYVPTGSIEAYSVANVWKDFINVKDISEIPAKVSATGFDGADDGNMEHHRRPDAGQQARKVGHIHPQWRKDAPERIGRSLRHRPIGP